MSTHPEMNNMPGLAPASEATASGQRENMAWLLRQFASETPGVTHAVLLSRDGLRLLDSDVDKDWADELSAALAGVASLAANITGPTHKKRPARQVVIERDDCLFFVQSAGRSAAFEGHPGSERGVVDTVLAVITAMDADAGTVGFEMGRLVQKFAPYMQIPVRVGTGDEVR
ncbi:putative regulator of Ras-like GTPase activity (Roadblock/LC7/MglB family) [Streptomyces puniciscabiei]|uniref:Putative regulator of Ras-like GTPase activity (Roadblock/LC7/MglB family) n=1 Tax=Streptomyces puniciscabiei TaxID=164348 RepID=A0A542UJ47_9ACTN|nr:roadblock/LC7 domain-containing protein [Streptomyces puniciscabiei]TQK99095.1 putative regulator of Ras-like GTPase activity (Roadblock/LC7/MglB family) [Streptomyces puniciscabiei]